MDMKFPFFHGEEKEDSLDIKEMIWRFKNLADAMGLILFLVTKWTKMIEILNLNLSLKYMNK